MTIRTTVGPLERVTNVARDDVRGGHPSESDRIVPVWVHRLHGDALPVAEASARGPLQDGSQRFVERWNRVASGY